MDFIPDRVLDFHPSLHRRGLRWKQRNFLLWPVRAWQVVTPAPYDRQFNILQRAVLRFHIAGIRQHQQAGELLGIDPDLIGIVGQELTEMGMLEKDGQVTERGHQLLTDAEFSPEEMRVGWVFQDTWTGELLPRFVINLMNAEVEADDEGRPWVQLGTKGNPKPKRATIVRRGSAPPVMPKPAEILAAVRRHRKHVRRIRQAEQELEALSSSVVHQISFIHEQPEDYHLLTFVYVPDEMEMTEEPWYVADPFGFGASTTLRSQLEKIRSSAGGGFRDLLDRITGEAMEGHRQEWLRMQELLRDQAREELSRCMPRSTLAGENTVRDRLELAVMDRIRLEQEYADGRDIRFQLDGVYLKVRQALEQAMRILRAQHAPGNAWKKLYAGNKWLPKDTTRRVIGACAEAAGFHPPIPEAIVNAKPGTVKAACLRPSLSNLRPLCATFLLAAADDEHHPLQRLAKFSPAWIRDLDAIANAAGDEIHGGDSQHTLADLQKDVETATRLCRELLDAVPSE